MGAIIIPSEKVKEEQIWGSDVPFFDKKMYRRKEFSVTYRRLEPGRYDATSYKLHDHGDSWEISFFVNGRIREYFEGTGTKTIGPGDLVIVEPHTKHGAVEVLELNEQVVLYIPAPKLGRY